MAKRNDASSWIDKGNKQLSKIQFKEALSSFQKAIDLDPINVEAWIKKGEVLVSLKNIDAAITTYDEALKIDPRSTRAWNLKGSALYGLERYEEALIAYDESLKVNPNDKSIWNSKGALLKCLSRYEEALIAYDEALKLDPNNQCWTWYDKADLLHSMCHYEEAISTYDKALSLLPNYGPLWNKKGNSLFELGRYEDAINAYDKALKLNPNSAGMWSNKGRALSHLNCYEDAIAAYEKALKLDPNNSTIKQSRENSLYLLRSHRKTPKSQNGNTSDPDIKTKKTLFPPDEPKKESIQKGFACVAGMKNLKEQLRKDVINFLKNPEQYKKFDVGLPNGILLFGPPGCGKTFIVQKLAEELGYHFIEAPPSKVGSKYIHETSQNIAKIFQEAKDKAPTILFFDEIEALVPKRELLGHEGTFRNEEVNEFLQHLNNASKHNILVVGATNLPALIDSSIKRPGRFDRIIYVGPPDYDARKELIKMGLKKVKFSDTIDFDKLAEKTVDYSSSDITLMVQDAKRFAAEHDLDEIDQDVLQYAVEKSKPSLTKSQIDNYRNLTKDEQ